MSRNILVVDDDRQMVQTLRDVLELSGWHTRGAHNGAEALEAVQEGEYDAVLMDIKMPGMDGVQALKAIKARRPASRVILMTAFTAPELIHEAQREGALQVLPKPVSLAPLLELLRTVLRRAESVLVVDDDQAFLGTLTDLLVHRGYAVIPVTSCDAAIDAMHRQTPAAVLLHLKLTESERNACLYTIRQVSPNVALILYSGQAADDDTAPPGLVRARLQKPFQVDQLTAVLDDIITH
jgi:DNA-binding NtrC family response regulator